MDETTDFYELLGVAADAKASEIKAAFKSMALKYHPDVYSGPDADEKMRLLLSAYKTLSDPSKRKSYDLAHGFSHSRSHYMEEEFGFQRSTTGRGFTAWSGPLATPKKAAASEAAAQTPPATETPTHFTESKIAITFPRLEAGAGAVIALEGFVYTLSAPQAARLREDGRLLGADLPQRVPATNGTVTGRRCTCHRCGQSWVVPPDQRRSSTDRCPKCSAPDWAEYLLLRCQECTAVFESQQIRRYDRVKIGERYYGDYHLSSPYELFPRCPNCQAIGWCAGEEMRLNGRKPQAPRPSGPIPPAASRRSASGGLPHTGFTGPIPAYQPSHPHAAVRRTRVPKALLTLIMALVIAGILLAIYAILVATH